MIYQGYDLTDAPIGFPGLFGDWRFTVGGKALDVGNGVYWYGILIACGLLLALWFCSKQAPRYGLTEDHITDVALWAVPAGVIGARAYYILFYLELYRDASGKLDFGKMIRIWDGGLAIYGGVIAGVLTAYLFCRAKKIKPGALMDCAIQGVIIGQVVGRWGNFMNREAFGAETTLPWRMRLWASESVYFDVHPTFLYESLWNLAGFLLIWLVVSKRRRFDGENLLCYLLWYGLGRLWIEGLREDSLYLFDWTIGGARVRVSQALSLALAAVAAILLAWMLLKKKPDPKELYVNQKQTVQGGESA